MTPSAGDMASGDEDVQGRTKMHHFSTTAEPGVEAGLGQLTAEFKTTWCEFVWKQHTNFNTYRRHMKDELDRIRERLDHLEVEVHAQGGPFECNSSEDFKDPNCRGNSDSIRVVISGKGTAIDLDKTLSRLMAEMELPQEHAVATDLAKSKAESGPEPEKESSTRLGDRLERIGYDLSYDMEAFEEQFYTKRFMEIMHVWKQLDDCCNRVGKLNNWFYRPKTRGSLDIILHTAGMAFQSVGMKKRRTTKNDMQHHGA